MNGRAIRQAAREQIKGRRGFLLVAVLLSNLPTVLCVQLLPRLGYVVPQALEWLVSLFCALLSLGVIKIALEQTESGPKTFGSLFFSFQKGIFLNGLILTLVLGLFIRITEVAAVALGEAGVWISLLISFTLELFFFPIRYYFVLYHDLPLTVCLRDGLRLGRQWCGDIFLYQLFLFLPVIVFFIIAFMLVFLSYLLSIVVVIIMLAGTTALIWYLPYVTLAQAMFAKEMILDEARELPPPPSKKCMKLARGDGWCRVNTATGKGAKNLTVKKDGEAIER